MSVKDTGEEGVTHVQSILPPYSKDNLNQTLLGSDYEIPTVSLVMFSSLKNKVRPRGRVPP